MICEKAVAIIKFNESLKLDAYYCPAGVLTIGYGHTGKDVKEGMRITEMQADAFLIKDISVAERAIKRLVKVPLNENQRGALASLVFNIGEGNFKESTLLKLLNVGADCSNEFDRWIKSNGKVLNGLVSRRKAEKLLFLT